MKKLLFVTCILGIMIGLCSCKSNPGATEPRDKIWIIKLQKPEYKNFVIANYNSGDSISALRFNQLGEPLGKSGYSPYWELTDDWLLIDWKWHNFPYLAGDVVILDEPWQNLTHHLQKWHKDVPHVAYPVTAIYTFEAKQLAAYFQKEEYEYIEPKYREALTMGKDLFVAKKDSVWTILQQDLTELIKNNALDKVCHGKTLR